MPSSTSRSQSAQQLLADNYKCPERVQVPTIDESQQKRAFLEQELRLSLEQQFVGLCVRAVRRRHPFYVGRLLSSGACSRAQLYQPQFLEQWTVAVRVRVRTTVKLGAVMKGIQQRLGIRQGFVFCLDGFFGVTCYGDIFGNVSRDSCPWMEITPDSTPMSLQLRDGDSLFVSVPNESHVRSVLFQKLKLAHQMPKQQRDAAEKKLKEAARLAARQSRQLQ